MEHARYWMWTKETSNNHLQHSSKNSSYYDSWEEQAFAEDAAAGSLIWPPRSYSCSFCRREFRSAQALGGHMNVHRRDRARLKQSPTTPPKDEYPNQEPQQNHLDQILRYQYPSHAFSFVNPNLDCNPALFHQSTALPSSMFLAPTIYEKSTKQTITESSYAQDNQRKSHDVTSSPFRSKLILEEYIPSSEPAGLRADDGFIISDSSSLSLSLAPTKSADISARIIPDNIEKVAAAGCKRRRTDESSRAPLFDLRSALAGKNDYVQAEVLKVCPSSLEDLDLELRLGDRPKVN